MRRENERKIEGRFLKADECLLDGSVVRNWYAVPMVLGY